MKKNIFQTHIAQDFIKYCLKLDNTCSSWANVNDKYDGSNSGQYDYFFFDDEMVETFVRENFDDLIWQAFNSLPLFVMKADLWRYLIVYKCGGIYADADTILLENPDKFITGALINIVPEFIPKHVAYAHNKSGHNKSGHNKSGHNESDYFAQWVFSAPADSPILKSIIDLAISRIHLAPKPITGKDQVYQLTGRGVFTDGIENYLKSNNLPIFSNKNDYLNYPYTEILNVYEPEYFNTSTVKHLFMGMDKIYGWVKEENDKNNKIVNLIKKKIFQTWFTKDLPEKMAKCVEQLKSANPEFEHILFDTNEREKYIKEHFSNFCGFNVYNIYMKLVPYEYKTDLWKYCVLYREGGIYLDIQYKTVGDFKFNDYIDKNYYSKNNKNISKGIFNGIMISQPSNPDLKKAIIKVIKNVNSSYYGKNPYSPTGSRLLGKIITYNIDFEYCSFHSKQIIKKYDGYEEENKKYLPDKSFYDLWKDKKIYGYGHGNVHGQGQIEKRIPETIFYICLNKNQLHNDIIEHNKKKSPNCNVEIYDNERFEEFIKENYKENTFLFWKKLANKERKNLFMKICLLYTYGGICLDNGIKLKHDITFFILFNTDCLLNKMFISEYLIESVLEKIIANNEIMIFKSSHPYLKILLKYMIADNKLLDSSDKKIKLIYHHIVTFKNFSEMTGDSKQTKKIAKTNNKNLKKSLTFLDKLKKLF